MVFKRSVSVRNLKKKKGISGQKNSQQTQIDFNNEFLEALYTNLWWGKLWLLMFEDEDLIFISWFGGYVKNGYGELDQGVALAYAQQRQLKEDRVKMQMHFPCYRELYQISFFRESWEQQKL